MQALRVIADAEERARFETEFWKRATVSLEAYIKALEGRIGLQPGEEWDQDGKR